MAGAVDLRAGTAVIEVYSCHWPARPDSAWETRIDSVQCEERRSGEWSVCHFPVFSSWRAHSAMLPCLDGTELVTVSPANQIVAGAGFEPAIPVWEAVFKTAASTSCATLRLWRLMKDDSLLSWLLSSLSLGSFLGLSLHSVV